MYGHACIDSVLEIELFSFKSMMSLRNTSRPMFIYMTSYGIVPF